MPARNVDPRDGSIHDEYVYSGWEQLKPKRRYGKAVPRIWTPPLRELTPETTLGFDVIDFAREVLGKELLPWQRWLAIHMLETLEDGSLRFRKAIVLVARQNGKSTFMQILAIYMMLAEAWPLVLGTAQDLGTAEEVWEDVVATLDDNPALSGFVKKVTKVNGKKALLTTSGERYLVKAANRRAGRGLRGNLVILDELREQQNWAAWAAISKTTNAQARSLVVGISNAGDVTSVVLRYLRLRAHKALGDPDGLDTEGTALAAATPTELDYKLEEQYIDEDDEQIYEIAVDPLVDDEDEDDDEIDDDEFYDDELDDDPLYEDEDDDEETLGLFEWSASPDCDRFDKSGWAQANPSLGHVMQIRAIMSDAKDDPEWIFRTEVLCQWADASLNGPFPAGAWERGQNKPFARADGSFVVADGDRYRGVDAHGVDHGDIDDRIKPGSMLDVCVTMSANRSMYALVAAGKRADGIDQVEVIAYRSGADWIEEFLLEDERYKGRIRRVTGQTRGAAVSPFMVTLTEHYEDRNKPWNIEVVPWAGADLVNACSSMFDAVVGDQTQPNPHPTVLHNLSPVLDVAAGNAVVKDLTGGWVIDDLAAPDGIDTSPLMGFAGALWLLNKPITRVAPPPPRAKIVRSTDPVRRSRRGGSLTSDLLDPGVF